MGDIVTLEIKDSAAVITMNRPEARNAISMDMIEGFHSVLDLIEKDSRVRAAIITGAGKAFCAGGDLNHPVFKLKTAEERAPLIERIYEVPRRIHRMPVPFIAAINGSAIGGGITLASFCDIRIASETAIFILNYSMIGVLPDLGGCYFLPNILGKAKAMELAMLGDKFDAKEALRIGFVSKIVPDDKIILEAAAIANRLVNLPPLAIQRIKKAIYDLPNKSMNEALDIEAGYFNFLLGTNDCREGTNAFFEKRQPMYTGT